MKLGALTAAGRPIDGIQDAAAERVLREVAPGRISPTVHLAVARLLRCATYKLA